MPRAIKRQCYQTIQPLKLYFEHAGQLKNEYLAPNQPLELILPATTDDSATMVAVKIPGLTPVFHVERADLKLTAKPISNKGFDQIRVNVESLQRVTGDFERFEVLPF